MRRRGGEDRQTKHDQGASHNRLSIRPLRRISSLFEALQKPPSQATLKTDESDASIGRAGSGRSLDPERFALRRPAGPGTSLSIDPGCDAPSGGAVRAAAAVPGGDTDLRKPDSGRRWP